jgi:protein SDA1
MIDLYKKNVWNDAKTVNIIAEACFSEVPKIAATALQFFLNSNQYLNEKDQDSDMEGAIPDLSSLKHSMNVNKKTKSRKAQMEKALATVKRVFFFTFFNFFYRK